MNANKTILLIVSGSIAAYKSLELARLVRKEGVRVIPVLTKGGAEFITPMSLSALCDEPCHETLFDAQAEAAMGHISLARLPDLVVVAPASADIIAKMAHGLADDLASTLLLACERDVMLFPAMNPLMWKNPATQDNIALLKRRGIICVPPAQGDTACGEEGWGRMLEAAQIFDHIANYLQIPTEKPLLGRKALITAGGTEEPIDEVRVITNRSSGRQGIEIARNLHALGAEVTLIYGRIDVPLPEGIKALYTPTAECMLKAVKQHEAVDIFVAAAAVADWKVKNAHPKKIKKEKGQNPPILEFVTNPDILALTADKSNQKRPPLVVGFAAECEDVLENASAKLQRKNCDMLIANQVGAEQGFGDCEHEVYFLSRSQTDEIMTEKWHKAPKNEIALQLCQKISHFFAG